MNIEETIKKGSEELKKNKIISHGLDAEMILSDIMGVEREFLLIKNNIKISRDEVVKKLLKKNIQTRFFFYPMHRQKILKKIKLSSKREKFNNADFLSKNGFYLPSGLGISNSEIDYVGKTLLKILNNRKSS